MYRELAGEEMGVDEAEEEEVVEERGGRSSWEDSGRVRTDGSEEELVDILFRRESRMVFMLLNMAPSGPPAKYDMRFGEGLGWEVDRTTTQSICNECSES